MPDPEAVPGIGGGRGVLFTDLDGTLLDFETFEPAPEAVEAVARLARRGVAVIPVTSKTAEEVRHLAPLFRFGPVAVVEGGAVLLPAAGDPVLLGPPRDELVAVLRHLQGAGWPVRGFSEMDAAELADVTGLSPGAAARALLRVASEPFLVTEEGRLPADPEATVARLGYGLVRGGRFWHLLGRGVDKGRGVEAVFQRYPELGHGPSGAVGDAWNDLAMLRRVQLGYLLGSAVPDEALPRGVERIAGRGPSGFAAAVERFLGELSARDSGDLPG